VAAIVQTVRPDILLINELDYDGATATLLAQNFFAKPQGDREPISYPYVYAAPSNAGVPTELDLNRNGQRAEPNDAFGYGIYPGQYAMAVYSRFPIETSKLRTFQHFLWKDLPNALQPIHPVTKQPYYDQAAWNSLRLSSKNHIDVPIQIGDSVIHVLASHPTPPVFDGPEDHNGCRNHDEIRFWQLYLSAADSQSLVDDLGQRGGLADSESFVIMGDLNADPQDGDSRRNAIVALLQHPRVVDPQASSAGAVEAAQSGRANVGDPRFDTAKFNSGNMRVDYVLPSKSLVLKDSGVFWPKRDAAEAELISASDHRMVWIEVEVP
jgi:Endonuclease/Exonuclease/phosphatase family